MNNQPDQVSLWLPRGDEHELAASLGMCEADPKLLRKLIEAARLQLAGEMPGVPVRVYRWHVWRVVRTMAKAGLLNTPDGRSAAFAILANRNHEHDHDDG